MLRRLNILVLSACASILASIGQPGHASESYACPTNAKTLTNLEIIQSAMDYEYVEYKLPRHIHDLGAAGLIERAPNCCPVERETYEFNENRRWFDRLLSLPVVHVSINWRRIDQTSSIEWTGYEVALCGNVLTRWGKRRE